MEYVDGLPIAEKEYTILMGVQIIAHANTLCAGEHCVIHNPSVHHMLCWPVVIRTDKQSLIERVCPHRIGHPDPDSLAYFQRIGMSHMGVHGCDGCCGPFEESLPVILTEIRARVLREAADRLTSYSVRHGQASAILRDWADEAERGV